MTGERRVRLAVVLGAVLAPLNSTMLAVALPAVMAEFGADVASAGWLMTGYLLALAVVQPVAGKLGDRFGRRGFMLGGLAVFGLAALGAALAPSLGVLVAMRMAQAIAGAVVFPNGAGLLRQLIPAERRGRAFGTMGAVLSLAAALGPPLGGVIVALGGWRAIFLVNVPVILAALVLGGRAIPRHVAAEGRAARFDIAGAVAFPALLLGVALLVVEGRHLASAWLAGATLAGLAGLAGLPARTPARRAAVRLAGWRAPRGRGGCLELPDRQARAAAEGAPAGPAPRQRARPQRWSTGNRRRGGCWQRTAGSTGSLRSRARSTRSGETPGTSRANRSRWGSSRCASTT